MNPADPSIEFPASWHDLTATGTRFAIMYELYALAHWGDDRYALRSGQHLKSICDTFFDDYLFYDNPEAMIGQSLYPDEIKLVKEFGNKINDFVNEFDIKNGIKENYHRTYANRDFIVPKGISDAAKNLLSYMAKRGDPKIECYFLNDSHC